MGQSYSTGGKVAGDKEDGESVVCTHLQLDFQQLLVFVTPVLSIH